ncbi:signal transduction histidine kinase [Alicyclobacillus sacchari]|uniref:histidine kinase n=2 Tax=Alicyclobacillaceae TaxID=186823 RepID=A0A4R8LA83_9BACL|nr:signal transduction histidine kinase [Alicyclobacillus sacchari]
MPRDGFPWRVRILEWWRSGAVKGFRVRRLVWSLVVLAIYPPRAPRGEQFTWADLIFWGTVSLEAALIFFGVDHRARRMAGSALAAWGMLCGLNLCLGMPRDLVGSLVWPMLGWITSVMQERDVPLSVCYVVICALDLAVVQPTWPGSVGYLSGYALLYVGIRGTLLRRSEHQRLLAAHSILRRDAREMAELAAEAERLRIARDMHDGVGHQLTALVIQLQVLQARARTLDERALFEDAVQSAQNALRDLRDAVHRMGARGGAGEDWLRDLTVTFSKRTAVSCSFETIGALSSVRPDVWMVWYRVLQELLANAVRHGRATAIQVIIRMEGSLATLQVTDNGSLRDLRGVHEGFGLASVRARVAALQGQMWLAIAPGDGLCVTVTIPIHEQEGSK